MTERTDRPVRRSMPWWLENALGLFGLPVAALIGLFTIGIWSWRFDPIVGDTGGLEPIAWGLFALRAGFLVWLVAWVFPGVRLRRPRRVALVVAAVLVLGLMHNFAYVWASSGGNCGGYAPRPTPGWHCGPREGFYPDFSL
jgi:hypothetical protein